MTWNMALIQLKFTLMQLKNDLLATGGTAKAACNLVRKAGGDLVGAAFLIELNALNGREKLADCGKVISMLQY